MDDRPLRQATSEAPGPVRLSPREGWELAVAGSDHRAFRELTGYVEGVTGRPVSDAELLGALLDHARLRLGTGSLSRESAPPDLSVPSRPDTFHLLVTRGLLDLEAVVAAVRRRR